MMAQLLHFGLLESSEALPLLVNFHQGHSH